MYYKNRFCIVKYSVISLIVASNLYGAPTGGTVVSGNATISQNANTTNINQSSNKAVINWQDFSIKSNETVNFNQPNSNSITLNRVIGNEKSIIDGALNANGQVWLINSNGVLFGKNAKVNTAGIVASTKDISNEDFNNGKYNFKGNSTASIVNEGEIKSLANTHATFIANSVTNKGKIEVHKGTINLVGASDVTLTLNENQNISLKVNKGVLDALVDNQNLIVANGGNVYLTTNAKDELLKGVVNHSGIIEASSLDELTQSEVILFAHGGKANISGTIDAKGGFVETSGEKLNVTNEAKMTARKWLLDPVNVTIDNQNGAIGSETVGATVIQTALNNNTDIEIQADNNINVNQAITWNTAQELTLNAGNNIYINKEITATNNAGKLALKYGQASSDGGTSDYYVNAKVNLKAGQNFSTQKGSNVANNKNYQVITALGSATSSNDGTLQGINANLNGNYVLGSNIDAGATKTNTANWGTIGFNPLGDWSNSFKGTFDGLGHTISDLYINRNSTTYVGLFGYINSSSTVKNIGLTNVDITGNFHVGGLAGENNGLIQNSYSSGSVNGNEQVGGLVGRNWGGGRVQNSYSTGTVEGNIQAGGLVGRSEGSTIENSYATGSVNGDYSIGGLVGYKYGGTISNSYSSGSVTGFNEVGGLVGVNENGAITNSYATGSVNGDYRIGGLVGYNYHGIISSSYATGNVSGYFDVGGFVGLNDNGAITNSYASGNVAGNFRVGGLVGYQFNGTILTSFYDKETNTASMNDSSYGKTKAEIATALKNASIEWETDLSKGRGYGTGGNTDLPFLKNVTKLSNTLFEDGFGTTLNPYTITNWTQLQNINNSNILTQYYYFNLLNNLSSSTSDYTNLASNTANGGLGWNPIGNSINKFNGTFDGLGFTISNLHLNRPDTDFVGLFGYTNSSAVIKNIGLKDVDIRGNYYVGVLVGFNENGTISNSYATGSVNGDYSIGGLVGYSDGTISNSYATGSVNGNSVVGGLVGYNDGTISNSYATGSVNGDYSIGGLVGYNFDGIIRNSYATGSVDGTDFLGGFIGSNYGTITNSYASGNVSGLLYTGGLVGENFNGTISNSFYDITKNPNYNNGLGVGKTTQEMSYGGTFKTAGWDIVADSSVTSSTPVIKWDSINNKYVWAIAPLTLTYTLTDKTTNYNGTTQNLSTFYNNSTNIFGTNHSFIDLSKYKFQVAGNDVTGYKDADIYNSIKLVNNSDSFTILNASGNTDGKLTINKADATVKGNSSTKTYNGTTQSVNGFTVNGLVGDDTADMLTGVSGTSASGKDAGEYSTNLSGTDTNYNLTFEDGKLTITKASLTATLNNNSKTYDGTSYSGGNGITFNGFVNGETASLLGGNLVYSGTSQGAKDAGNYIISGSGLTSNNYNISFVDGELTINKKDLTISNIIANNKTYDGTTTATLSNSGTLVGLVTGEDLVLNNPTSVIFSSKDVADGIVVTASGYTISNKDSFKASNYNLLDTSKTTTANIVASVNPTPNPTPSDNNQKPKVDEKVQRVIASIEPSTNSNSSSNQSVPNSLNSNIRTLSFSGVDEIRVINGGVRIPDDIVNSLDEL